MGGNRSRGGWAREHAGGERSSRRLDEVGEGAQEGGPGPDVGVGTNVEDPLKVASPGRFPSRAVEDSVIQCLWGIQASGAGGWDIAISGGVGAEVALPRSHLVEAASGELVKAHKRVGLYRGAVGVAGRVRRSLFPLFHQEVLALKLELGV